MEAILQSSPAQRKSGAKPPRVPAIPLVGNYFDLKQLGIVQFLQKIRRECGDVVHFSLLGNNFYLLSNPADIENILIRDSANFEKDMGLRLLKRYALGTSLLTATNDEHKEMRKQSSKAFSRKSINGYTEAMVELTAEHTAHWKAGQTINIHEEMMALTAKIAAVTLFNSKIDERVLRIGKALAAVLELTNYLMTPVAEIVTALPSPMMRRVNDGIRELDDIIYSFVDEHLKGLQKPDFLSQLIDAKKEQGVDVLSKQSRKQLRDEALTIFLAGHETTANALTWTWALLSQHPAEAEKMRAEIRRVSAAGPMTSERIAELTYTRQIFSEAMRLYPPAWAVGRYVKEDYEVGGYVIPRKSEVWLSQYVVHHDERWHNNPEVFDPSRFTEEEIAKRPRLSYFPFSAGPRNCIGEQFAWLEGAIVLAGISQKFAPTLRPETKLEVMPQVTLRPKHPMLMELQAVG